MIGIRIGACPRHENIDDLLLYIKHVAHNYVVQIQTRVGEITRIDTDVNIRHNRPGHLLAEKVELHSMVKLNLEVSFRRVDRLLAV